MAGVGLHGYVHVLCMPWAHVIVLDKETCSVDPLAWFVLFSIFFVIFCLLVNEYRHFSCGHLAVASSGAPPTTIATSGMARTGAHSCDGCHSPSSTGIVDSTPAASPCELFSRDDLLALVFGMSSHSWFSIRPTQSIRLPRLVC